MKRGRKLVSALVGLVFLLQGMAAFAGPLPDAQPDPAPAAADMPCHGQPDAGSQAGGNCCDADCPNMAHCLLSHFTATAAFQFPSAAATIEKPPRISTRLLSRAPPILLRPPITLHG